MAIKKIQSKNKSEESTTSPHKGRPRNFDRQVALERALGVFWNLGYDPASLTELCNAMEISPPSLYAAFGNKAKLFMEAVNYYETFYWESTWKNFEEEPDINKALQDFINQHAKILTSQDIPCGCMVILAATNISAEGQEVNNALKALRKEGRDIIYARFKKALKDKQLPQNTDIESLATTINTFIEGMSLLARDGASRKELEKISKVVMGLLPKVK